MEMRKEVSMIATTLRIFYTVAADGIDVELEAALIKVLDKHGYHMNPEAHQGDLPHGHSIRDMRFDKGDNATGPTPDLDPPVGDPDKGDNGGNTEGGASSGTAI